MQQEYMVTGERLTFSPSFVIRNVNISNQSNFYLYINLSSEQPSETRYNRLIPPHSNISFECETQLIAVFAPNFIPFILPKFTLSDTSTSQSLAKPYVSNQSVPLPGFPFIQTSLGHSIPTLDLYDNSPIVISYKTASNNLSLNVTIQPVSSGGSFLQPINKVYSGRGSATFVFQPPTSGKYRISVGGVGSFFPIEWIVTRRKDFDTFGENADWHSIDQIGGVQNSYSHSINPPSGIIAIIFQSLVDIFFPIVYPITINIDISYRDPNVPETAKMETYTMAYTLPNAMLPHYIIAPKLIMVSQPLNLVFDIQLVTLASIRLRMDILARSLY